jgi:hypothetical protein
MELSLDACRQQKSALQFALESVEETRVRSFRKESVGCRADQFPSLQFHSTASSCEAGMAGEFRQGLVEHYMQGIATIAAAS